MILLTILKTTSKHFQQRMFLNIPTFLSPINLKAIIMYRFIYF